MASLNVLLIKPPLCLSSTRISGATGTPPIGMAYIAAYLQQKNIPVRIIDSFGENPYQKTPYGEQHNIFGLTNEQIIDRITEDVDIVGISCMFSNEWFYVKELIIRIKEKFPNMITVLGGEHATALPKYIMESCNALDYLILGEGEIKFYKLLECLSNKRNEIEKTKGIVYKKQNQVVINENTPSSKIKDLDSLPFPAWNLIPIEIYLKEGLATISSKGERIMPILASRGCPYSCKFCSNAIMWGNSYVIRDYQQVVEEIKEYKKKYNISGFEFQDLTFITQKSWVINFCKQLIKENLNLKWNIPTTRAESIDEELIYYLKKSDCTNLCLTPDSGSDFQLKDMDKRVNLRKMTNTVKLLLKKGIVLKVNLVIGFPNEKHRHVLKTILYGMKLAMLGVNSVIFYRFVPYPGSVYFENLQKNGKLPQFGPKFDEFLSTNTYNELMKVYSFSKHISNLSIRIYLFSGYILSTLTYILTHPVTTFKMFKNIKEGRASSQIETILIQIFTFLKEKISTRSLKQLNKKDG